MTWYVLAIKSHRQPSIEEKLDAMDIGSHYFKKVVWRKQRKGPRKCVEYPLIPSYLFVDVDLEVVSAKTILSIDGVLKALGVGGDWGEVDLPLFNALLDSERRGDFDETLKRIEQLLVGETMAIEEGPFEGYRGVITAINNGKAELDVKMFGQSTAVKINVDKLARPI